MRYRHVVTVEFEHGYATVSDAQIAEMLWPRLTVHATATVTNKSVYEVQPAVKQGQVWRRPEAEFLDADCRVLDVLAGSVYYCPMKVDSYGLGEPKRLPLPVFLSYARLIRDVGAT